MEEWLEDISILNSVVSWLGYKDCQFQAIVHENHGGYKHDKKTDRETSQRRDEVYTFMLTTTRWYEQLRRWPTQAIVKFVKLGDRAMKLLGVHH